MPPGTVRIDVALGRIPWGARERNCTRVYGRVHTHTADVAGRLVVQLADARLKHLD